MENRAFEKYVPVSSSDDEEPPGALPSRPPSLPPTVAVIDDDVQLRSAVQRMLQSEHKCAVVGFHSVEDFLVALDSRAIEHIDLILLDFHLPGQSGPKLVEELIKRDSPLLHKSYIMGMTGDPERLVENEFRDAGIEEIIQKPLSKIDFTNISNIAHTVNKKMANIAYASAQNAKVPNAVKKYI